MCSHVTAGQVEGVVKLEGPAGPPIVAPVARQELVVACVDQGEGLQGGIVKNLTNAHDNKVGVQQTK